VLVLNSIFDTSHCDSHHASMIPIAPYCSQQHRLTNNQREHRAALCAKRHPNADFTGSLHDRVRRHAKDADGGEQDGDPGKEPEQNGVETT
jgi:hypothetical protein